MPAVWWYPVCVGPYVRVIEALADLQTSRVPVQAKIGHIMSTSYMASSILKASLVVGEQLHAAVASFLAHAWPPTLRRFPVKNWQLMVSR